MTRTDDIERVLDRFYAEGPSEMPDRLFLSVVDQIERVPQRRLANQMTRFATMNPRFRLAAAAAIVVAVVGVTALALSQRSSVGPASTPTASPVAVASSPASLPVAIRSRWVGGLHAVPQVGTPYLGMQIDASEVTFFLSGPGNRTQFRSRLSPSGPDVLSVQMEGGDVSCRTGDVGTYHFVLSPNGSGLTLTSLADSCPSRSAALAGIWVRAGCPASQGWCLGDLEEGANTSISFDPLAAPTSSVFTYGAFSYSVPAGWTNGDDSQTTYSLAKQGAPANTAIFIWSNVVPHGQAQQCAPTPEPGIGRTADAMTTWLTKLPGLVTNAPIPVSIGGLTGKQVDLSVAPTWKTSCPYAYSAGLPLVSTFTSPTVNGVDWNIQGQGRTRIIALDLPDGRSLVIDIEGQTKADYDALLPDAMQVVNTFQFVH